MRTLKIPVGVKDFRSLVRSGYLFADKSLLIKEIIDSGSNSILYTRPRRFGKTLALSMIDRFFNISYREEESKDDSFSGLLISKQDDYPSSYSSERNTYPIVRLDMSAIPFKGSFEEDMRSYLRSVITFKFGYLKQSVFLSDDIKALIFGENDSRTSGEVVSDLCAALSIHHGKDPMILIDEYDSPIEGLYRIDASEQFLTQYGAFLKIALKVNLHTSRIILSGIQKIVVGGIFSALNDLVHVGVTCNEFNEYFGLTAVEMKDMIKTCVDHRYESVPQNEREIIVEKHFALATEWFDGYHIGSEDIFNPWSAMNFLRKNVLDDDPVGPYWTDTAENGLLSVVFSSASPTMMDDLKDAYVSGQDIIADLTVMSTPLWKDGSVLTRIDILTMLLSTGYLTSRMDGTHYVLSIPNKEVRMGFDDLMLKVYCVNVPDVIPLLEHIRRRESSKVENDLEVLMAGGSYLDGWSEKRYKSWLHDLFAINGYTSITERELGDGRVDLLIEGSGHNPPIIFEFKIANEEEVLDDVASTGVDQILTNRYHKGPGMDGCIALSVAFRKKSCSVKFV